VAHYEDCGHPDTACSCSLFGFPTSMTLSPESWDRLLRLLNNPPNPTLRLRAAALGTSVCDPRFAVVRCWEHEDCIEHPDLAFDCADGREAEWTVMEAGFELYPDWLDGGGYHSYQGLWVDGRGGGDWPGCGDGAECAGQGGTGDGEGRGLNSRADGDGYGLELNLGWQP